MSELTSAQRLKTPGTRTRGEFATSVSLPRSAQLRITQSGAAPGPLQPRRLAILEADDLGLLHAFNEGIRAAYQLGALTSTCLRANGFAYQHAVHEILPACQGIGVGVHLCLNEAGSVAPPATVPLLLDGRGQLRGGFLWLMRLARTKPGLAQIETEFRAQIERVLADGIRPDHLNSHQHVHMIPAIFRLTCRLAREYGIPCVRLARELPYMAGGLRKRVQPFVNSNVAKHLLLNTYARVNEPAAQMYQVATPDYFVGVSYTAHMSLTAVLAGLRATPYGSVEVLLHPAIGPDPRDLRYPSAALRRYVRARQRATELRSLRSAKLADFLRQEFWVTTNFSTFAQLSGDARPAEQTPAIDPEVASFSQQLVLRCPPWVSEAQPDSRAFAQLVVSQTRAGQRLLDIGTGTGVIAICAARFGRQAMAVDISSAALRTAKTNARHAGVELECRRSDLLSKVEGRFDLIAFNPPYNFRPDNVVLNLAKHLARRVDWIRRNSGLAMPRPVLKFHQQLIARLISQAPARLNPGGAILLHAYEAEVRALSAVLPASAAVTILRHPDLRNRTVGMLVRLSQETAR